MDPLAQLPRQLAVTTPPFLAEPAAYDLLLWRQQVQMIFEKFQAALKAIHGS